MSGIVSSCAIVTLSLTFSDIRLQKCRDLEIRVRGHSRSLKVVPFDKLGMISYWCSIETLSPIFEIFDFYQMVDKVLR